MSNELLERKLSKLYEHHVYYANLFFRVRRIKDNKNCPTMGVGVQNGEVKMIYNEEFIEKLTTPQFLEVLKHEALHLINKHIFNAQPKDKTEALLNNLAMDCSINQLLDETIIKEIGGMTLDGFRDMVKETTDPSTVEANQTWQYYYKLLQQELDDRKEKGKGEQFIEELGEGMDSHDGFGQGMDALDQAALDDALNEAKKAVERKCGKLPQEIEDMYKLIKKPTLKWKRILRRFVGEGLRSERKSSRMKRNRRYGITIPGKKKDYKARILTVIDTSGSMMWENRLEKVMSEVYGIYNGLGNVGIDICECDAQIQDVFSYEGKDKFSIKGGGGTEMLPALEYAKEKAYDAVVFLTDGEFYSEGFNRFRGLQTLWVIAGNAGYVSPIGTTVHLED